MTSSGLGAVLSRLKGTPAKVRKGLTGQFAQDGATLVTQMQRLAPVKSGALRKSIKATPAKDGIGVQITAGGQTTSKKIRKSVKDKDAAAGKGLYDYALAVEFGNSHEAPQPFFYPTLRAAKAGIARGVSEAIKKAIKP